MRVARHTLFILITLTIAGAAGAQEWARLLRFPDLHGDRIVFTYADDVWTASAKGGTATRLTTLAANKFAARFSPNGKWIAFTAERGGNYDVYVVPSSGGTATRLTWHPMPDFVAGWTADSTAVLFRSRRTSVTHPVDHLFTVPVGGGAVAELPITNGGPGSFSPSGDALVYTSNPAETWNPWHGYRGGRHAQLAIFDLRKKTQVELAPSDANDVSPSWIGNTIYFASDRDGRMNLYSFDRAAGGLMQLTHERDADVRNPSVTADGRAIYAKDGELHVLDLKTHRDTALRITPAGDFPQRRPRDASVAPYLTSFALSADGKGALISARGEVFEIDSATHAASDLTKTPGSRELSATASPDGQSIAYVSDVAGEYEIYVRSRSDGAVRRVTSDGHGFRDGLRWSPDSRHLLFTDETLSLSVVDTPAGTPRRIDQSVNGPIEYYEWAPDSRSVIYSKAGNNQLGRIYRYDLATAVARALTDGMTDDFNPVIDAAGERLYFLSARNFRTSFSDFEQTFNFNDTVGIYSAPSSAGELMSSRTRRLPIDASSLSRLSFAAGKLLYIQRDRRNGMLTLHAFDLVASRDRTVIADISDYAVQGNTLLIQRDSKLSWQSIDSDTPQAQHDIASLTMHLDPAAEWRQIFLDAWRLERDYFYNPRLNGTDWIAIRKRYEPQLPSVATREDLNFLLTQMVAELGVSHSWVVGGDMPRYDVKPVGVLGADLIPDGARYRIAHIYPSSDEQRSPFDEAGVATGSLLVAIDGQSLTSAESLEARLDGTAGKEVTLTIATVDGRTSDVKVKPLGNDMPLRYAEWVAANRARVLQATGARCGYIHVPNTGRDGIAAFAKQFVAQIDKEALIVDIRWNSGGLFPASMIEHLRRITLAHEASRYGNDLRVPGLAVEGSKVLIANQNTISGGDSFAIYFRNAAIGPIIGTRTAGATVGNVGMPSLIDGGEAAVAALAYWEPAGNGTSRWAVENRGVVPDIEIRDVYDRSAAEPDPQLAKAIDVIREQLRVAAPRPMRPAYHGGQP
jgi:tricorn protease